MVRLEEITISDTEWFSKPSTATRRDNRQRGAGKVSLEDKEFVAWDGEGMTINGRHEYVLFGNSTGARLKMNEPGGLQVEELLDFIVEQGIENPDANHVGFAFNYDVNMIIRNMPGKFIRKLHESANGFVRWKNYGITYRPSKWFQVTRYRPGYNSKTNPSASDTTRIYDIFGFFVCSFVSAVEKLLGTDLPMWEIVTEGKKGRSTFVWDEMDTVERYWEIEIGYLEDLAEELRSRLYGADLKIAQWHGPGALANYKLKQKGIKEHMNVWPEAVKRSAAYAYAGGRFELFQFGRIKGPIYSIDINSAYPSYIRSLPSFGSGFWRHVENPDVRSIRPFAVYRVQLHMSVGFDHKPGPFFHRDDKANISYPWTVDNWVWAPEIHHFRVEPGSRFKILEGWEFVSTSDSSPFDWVNEVYNLRREWKASGNTNEYALKLLLNSLYGKMAQRVGWDEENERLPPWHQLEWAGWVTASTRAQLYSIMRQIPQEDLIAVETDGIYTTYPPDKLGIANSKELGEWSIDVIDEMVYLQSGLAFYSVNGEWKSKYRGLDKDSITIDSATEYLKSLRPNEQWHPYCGTTTRFVGMGAALMRKGPLERNLCRWETEERLITPGEKGKRIHFPPNCSACRQGLGPNEAPHQLVIRSLSAKGVMSNPHDIPWEKERIAEWRAKETEAKHLLIVD